MRCSLGSLRKPIGKGVLKGLIYLQFLSINQIGDHGERSSLSKSCLGKEIEEEVSFGLYVYHLDLSVCVLR